MPLNIGRHYLKTSLAVHRLHFWVQPHSSALFASLEMVGSTPPRPTEDVARQRSSVQVQTWCFFSNVWVMGTFLESPKGPASTAGTTYGFLGFLQFLPYFTDWVSSAGWNALAFVLSLDVCSVGQGHTGPMSANIVWPSGSDVSHLPRHVYWQVVSPTELCREPSSVARAPRK